jgi:hypothetical protein
LPGRPIRALPGRGGPNLFGWGAFAGIEYLRGNLEAIEESLGAALVNAGGGENAHNHGDAFAQVLRCFKRRQFHGGPMEARVEIAEHGAAHGW